MSDQPPNPDVEDPTDPQPDPDPDPQPQPEGDPQPAADADAGQEPASEPTDAPKGDEMAALSEFMKQRGLSPGHMVYLYDQYNAAQAARAAQTAGGAPAPAEDPQPATPNFAGGIEDADYVTGKDLRAALAAQETHLTAKARAETTQQGHARVAAENGFTQGQKFIYESAVDRLRDGTPDMSIDEAYAYTMKEMGHGVAPAGAASAREKIARAARGAQAPPVSVPGRSTTGPPKGYEDAPLDINSPELFQAFSEEIGGQGEPTAR